MPRLAVRLPLPDNIAAQSALVLDMIEFCFRNGTQWAQGFESGIGTRHCLLSAVIFVRRELCGPKDNAPDYLMRVIAIRKNLAKLSLRLRAPTNTDVITNFNDARGRNYSTIADVLRTAKELAEADARAWGGARRRRDLRQPRLRMQRPKIGPDGFPFRRAAPD